MWTGTVIPDFHTIIKCFRISSKYEVIDVWLMSQLICRINQNMLISDFGSNVMATLNYAVHIWNKEQLVSNKV